MRPLRPVAIVIGSLVPEVYSTKIVEVCKSSMYRSPEALPDSWLNLCKIVTSYFISKGMDTLDPCEYEDKDKIISDVLSNRVDYREYFLVSEKKKSNLSELIIENKNLLNLKHNF